MKKYPGINPNYSRKFFISDKRALEIVNSQKKMYKRWLKTCKIAPKGTSALDKQALLETIDKIVEAKMKAPANLIESFTKQLRKEAVDDELHYLGVPKPLTTGMKLADRRNIINEILSFNASTLSGEKLDSTEKFKNDSPESEHSEKEDLPAPMHDGETSLSDSSSESDLLSEASAKNDGKRKPPVKLNLQLNKSKKKSRFSLCVNQKSATRRTIPSKKSQKTPQIKRTQPNAVTNNNAPQHQEEISRLTVAIDTLQRKIMEITDENEKKIQRFTELLKEGHERQIKLEKEISSQKHCIDILLEKGTAKSSHKSNATKTHGEAVAIKSDIIALKTSLDSQLKKLAAKDDEIQATLSENLQNVARKVNNFEEQQMSTNDKVYRLEMELSRSAEIQSQNFNTNDKLKNVAQKVHNIEQQQIRTIESVCKLEMDISRNGQAFTQNVEKTPIPINVNIRVANLENPEVAPLKNVSTTGTNTESQATGQRSKVTTKLTDHSLQASNATNNTNQRNDPGHPAYTHNQPGKQSENNRDRAGNDNDTYRRRDKSQFRTSHGSYVSHNQDSSRNDSTNKNERSHRNERRLGSRKCLLIHDSTFDGFDSNKFTRQFDITTLSIKKVAYAAKSKLLKEKVEKERPECIYIHLGLHDIIGSQPEDVIKSFKDLLDVLLNITYASICFSSIVPTSSDEQLNKKINLVNGEVKKMITSARKADEDLKDVLFTYCNDSVGWLNKKTVEGVILSDRGKKTMWIKLVDGIRKTLRLDRPKFNRNSHSNSRSRSSQINSNND
ncbi:hypothetical protein ACHWQZ_G017974 [Mnemiopsis leidyi]